MGGILSNSPPKLLNNVEKGLVYDLVTKNCVVLFSKTQCIYCKNVKKILSDNNVRFLSIELDKREDGTNLQNALHEMTGARTVPRVFINSECIGGASDTEKLLRENKLLDKIRQCDKNI